MAGTMPRLPRRSLVLRCLLVGLLVAVPVACKSGRGERTTPSTTTTTSTTSTSTSTTTTLPPTTTTEALVTTGAAVLVANASAANGAAGVLTDDLRAAGFTVGDPTNGFGPEASLAVSKIYVIAGSEAVAKSISRLMGGVTVAPMPTPAWISGGTARLKDATVLVMLGNDKAGKHLAEMATG